MKNIKNTFLLLSLLLILTVFFNGCYKDKAEKLYPGVNLCDTSAMKYAIDISPILSKNCAFSGCHTTSNKAGAGGYAFDSYSETILAVPNKKLIHSIQHVSGTIAMPKGALKLDDCDINKIVAWINQGALNN